MHPEQLRIWVDEVEAPYISKEQKTDYSDTPSRYSKKFLEWFRSVRGYEWGDSRYRMTTSQMEDFRGYYKLLRGKTGETYDLRRQELGVRINKHSYDMRDIEKAREIQSNEWAEANDQWRAAIREADARKQKLELAEVERTCVWCGAVVEGDLDAHEEQCTS